MFMSRFIHQEIVQAAIQAEHLHAVFDRKDKVKQPTAGVYAIPSPDADPDSNEFIVFKIISMHPERRSYLQRAFILFVAGCPLSYFPQMVGIFWKIVCDDCLFGHFYGYSVCFAFNSRTGKIQWL